MYNFLFRNVFFFQARFNIYVCKVKVSPLVVLVKVNLCVKKYFIFSERYVEFTATTKRFLFIYTMSAENLVLLTYLQMVTVKLKKKTLTV